jgi:hypothetical protein
LRLLLPYADRPAQSGRAGKYVRQGKKIMREFTKALFSYTLATSLFGVKQMANLLIPTGRDQSKSPATKAFDALTHAATDQFDETLNSTFRMLDNVQRGVVNLGFSVLTPFSSSGRSGGQDTYQTRQGVEWSSEPHRWTDVMPEESERTADGSEERAELVVPGSRKV